MASVTLAQCWYFVQDVLQLEDGGFDRWHRLSFFIHPILLIVCPVFNFFRLVGRWLLFLILLPFRTVGGAIVLVGRGANKFADQCRTFVVFISEFYEVPSRESDAHIGGYIVLPFSSGLRVLVLAKEEEEDEEDEEDEEYEDCVPLLEGGDEQAFETFFLLEDGNLTLEASDHPRDVSPLLQTEDFTLARRTNDPEDVTQQLLLEGLSFRFHSDVSVIRGGESSQMESADPEDEEREEEPAVQASEGGHVDEGYSMPMETGYGRDEDGYATHVSYSGQRNLITFHKPTAPMASPSHGFLDRADHGGGSLSVDVGGGREEGNYTPRRSRRVSSRSVAEVAVDSDGWRDSPRSVLEAAQDSRHRRRGEVEENVDRFKGPRVLQRSFLEAAQDLHQGRRREAEEEEEADRFHGSRVSPRFVPVAQEVHRNRRREANDVDQYYSSRVSPRSAPQVTQETHGHGASGQAEEGDRFYASYMERVAWFDRLNAERRSTVSVIWNITLRCTSLQERIEPLNLSCRGCVPKNLVKSLGSDFEAIYVGQTCLCWEALHYQYRKVEDITFFQDPNLPCFDATIMNMFQQLEISMVRFVESEMFSGDRFWNFAEKRFSDRILLQIPDVTAYNARGGQREEIVTANQLLPNIQSAIRTFWHFIRSDDKKKPSPWKHRWTDCPVENPRDLKFLSQIKKVRKEKKEKLKKMLRNHKVMTSPCDELEIEMLISIINLQLVSWVLKMSIITTQQLMFCREKLEGVQLNRGSLARPTSWCLFPYA